MSQVRAICTKLRAIFASAAVCALLFGLLVSGAAQASAPVGSRVGFDAAAHDVALCPVRHLLGAAANDPSRSNHGGAQGQCPDCCLAAHTSVGLAPERVSTVARPATDSASPVAYFAFSAREPESAVSSFVNGARAPPSRRATS